MGKASRTGQGRAWVLEPSAGLRKTICSRIPLRPYAQWASPRGAQIGEGVWSLAVWSQVKHPLFASLYFHDGARIHSQTGSEDPMCDVGDLC